MPRFVNHLADLTALRDRQHLDDAVVSTLDNMLKPRSVQLHRLVGPETDARWITTSGMRHSQRMPQPAASEIDLDALPAAQDFPQRMHAIETRHPLLATGHANLSLFPVVAEGGNTPAILEIERHPLSESDAQLVLGVLRLYQNLLALLDYGERDTLTELLNRKTFDNAFLRATTTQFPDQSPADNERRRAQGGSSYWLVLLDIDHFKRVNDSYGHLIGDEVLILVARLMRANFRFHDQIYRFGGEEFVVLMHSPDQKGTLAALERLRKTVEDHQFPQVGHITVSIGVTQILHGDTPSCAFERADKAVYHAKEHGRNQVHCYEQLVESGALSREVSNVGDVELF